MLSPEEFAEVLNYVNEKHGWNHLMTNVEEGRKIIKYVDCCMDTRDGKIWCCKIKFRQISNSHLPNDIKFDNIIFEEGNLTKEKIYEWLANN